MQKQKAFLRWHLVCRSVRPRSKRFEKLFRFFFHDGNEDYKILSHLHELQLDAYYAKQSKK